MDMYEAKSAAAEKLGLNLCKTMEAHGFDAAYAADKKTALAMALDLIRPAPAWECLAA